MRVLTRILLAAAMAAILYLALWPVPIDPVSWQAPPDPGYVDPHARNDRLEALETVDLAPHAGPEDGAFGPDGALYVGTVDGRILRIGVDRSVSVFASPGGRPLGLDFDANGNLLVANAFAGLQRITAGGHVETLLERVGRTPLRYPNDVAVGADGRVFLSESTTRFAAAELGGTLATAVADIMEHGDSGRIIEYRPDTGDTRIFADGLSYANGVAVSEDQQWLLVVEGAQYRVWRYPLAGGAREVVLENLPGFPDNLNNGRHGRVWVGLVAPRNALVDRLSGWPRLRKVVQRLPAFVRPEPARYAHVVAFTVDGQVLMDLQGPGGRAAMLTGVLEAPDALYLTTLTGTDLPRLDKTRLAPR